MKFESTLNFAKSLDDNDELKFFRNYFYESDEKLIYLDGNSLGKLPLKTKELLNDVIEKEWGSRLIRSWNESWLSRITSVRAKIAQIVGAETAQINIGDSVSINLFKLAYAALSLNSQKKEIVTDSLNFPSDIYILESVKNLLGGRHQLKIIKSKDDIKISTEEIISECSENTALVVLSHVVFKSAYKYDVPKITAELRKKGIFVIWDLSHSVGSIPIYLDEWNCDFAVGCTYKYLNGGPGSPAFLFVNKNLISKIQNPIWGWFGADKPFNFDLEFSESNSIEKFNVGTQPMISLSALDASLDLTIKAGMEKIREKNILLTDYLIYLTNVTLLKHGIEIGSPQHNMERGSHITLKHKEGYRICKAMIENEKLKVIPDFRKPNNIRLGVNSLYNSFAEVFTTVKRIEEILVNKEYENYDLKFDAVT